MGVVSDGALITQHGSSQQPTATPPSDMMRLGQLQRPIQAVAVAGSCRPTLATFALPSRPAIQSTPAQAQDGVVEGRRYASVKSQGAYRIPNKKTIAKKLGAKKSGGMFRSAVATTHVMLPPNRAWHAKKPSDGDL